MKPKFLTPDTEGRLRGNMRGCFGPFSSAASLFNRKLPDTAFTYKEEVMLRKIITGFNRKTVIYRDGEPVQVLSRGTAWIKYSCARTDMVTFDETSPWIGPDYVRDLVRSGIADAWIKSITLNDEQRALVWIDGRFTQILGPGEYAYWNTVRKVKIETVSVNQVQFEHKDLFVILALANAQEYLEQFTVQEGYEGLYFLDSRLVKKLDPGRYAFWKNAGKIKLYHKDLKEQVLDISGQEIMTGDKVSIRLNAVLTYRIRDSFKAVLSTEDINQSLYRETQLAVRATVGTKELDAVLTEKDLIAEQMLGDVSKTAEKLGLEITSLGIRDIILPGEMKVLMNRVTEAKKAAEANLISRREEVAAMRSQLNTAKMLEQNAVLMRMRELEVLEKIAEKTKMNVFLGNEKLSERIMNIM